MSGCAPGRRSGRLVRRGRPGSTVASACVHGGHPDAVREESPKCWLHHGPGPCRVVKVRERGNGVEELAEMLIATVRCTPGTAASATGGDVRALELLGLLRAVGLQRVSGDLAHLGDDGQRGAGDAVEFGRLHNVHDHALAPIPQWLDDRAVVPRASPSDNINSCRSHRNTPWTTDLQVEGTPAAMSSAPASCRIWQICTPYW